MSEYFTNRYVTVSLQNRRERKRNIHLHTYKKRDSPLVNSTSDANTVVYHVTIRRVPKRYLNLRLIRAATFKFAFASYKISAAQKGRPETVFCARIDRGRIRTADRDAYIHIYAHDKPEPFSQYLHQHTARRPRDKCARVSFSPPPHHTNTKYYPNLGRGNCL